KKLGRGLLERCYVRQFTSNGPRMKEVEDNGNLFGERRKNEYSTLIPLLLFICVFLQFYFRCANCFVGWNPLCVPSLLVCCIRCILLLIFLCCFRHSDYYWLSYSLRPSIQIVMLLERRIKSHFMSQRLYS